MTKTEIPLEVADLTVAKIIELLKPLCERIEVAGSLRRKRPLVHDIDIVLIPNTFMWAGTIPNTLIKQLGAKMAKNGPLIKQFIIDDIQVDLIHATTTNWGIRMLRWTGSMAHNIMLAGRAKSLGMKLAVSQGLLDRDRELITAKTEKAIFEALHLDYVEPQDREVNQ